VYDLSYLYVARDSRPYKAGLTGDLPTGCAARQFAERPETLRHFRFRYGAERFAIFEVIP
jgi:hypothetical protein